MEVFSRSLSRGLSTRGRSGRMDGFTEAAVGRDWNRAAYGSSTRMGATKYEVCLECDGLPNMDGLLSLSDPFAVMYEVRGLSMVELGRTETVWDDLDPKFVRCFVLNYQEEAPRELMVEVYDRDSNQEGLGRQDFIGSAKFALGDVVNSQDRKLRLELKGGDRRARQNGHVSIMANSFNEAVVDHMVEIRLNSSQLSRRGLIRTVVPQFYTLSRGRVESSGRRSWTPVYRSEVKSKASDTGMLRFESAVMNLQALNNGNFKAALRIEFWARERRKAHERIGFVDLSLEVLHLMARRAEDRRVAIEGTFADQRIGDMFFREGRVHADDLRDYFEMDFNYVSNERFISSNLAPSRQSSANRSDSALQIPGGVEIG